MFSKAEHNILICFAKSLYLHTIVINSMNVFSTKDGRAKLFNEDFLNCYKNWPKPTVIISDGPYGIDGFPGDLKSPEDLEKWYEPYIDAWTKAATPQTTLWFWNTELGWANVHKMIVNKGWQFVNCHTWDKGLSHIAGNVNTKTIRQFPVVTEVCVQYVKKPEFTVENKRATMQEWLRYEWKRTGLPFSKTNEACGVKNAATRKYFTNCNLWYYPPSEAFEKITQYANAHGEKKNKPYFSINGKTPITKQEWESLRAKFYCRYGINNVWRENQLNGSERLKNGTKTLHNNQKPLKFFKIIIEACTDKEDVVWEPFGGLCPSAISALELGRISLSSEINSDVFLDAVKRVKTFDFQSQLSPLLS